MSRKRFQGLQIPGGAFPSPLESLGWLGAFLIREAILLCPDDLIEEEEVIYINAIGRFTVSVPHIMLSSKLIFDSPVLFTERNLTYVRGASRWSRLQDALPPRSVYGQVCST